MKNIVHFGIPEWVHGGIHRREACAAVSAEPWCPETIKEAEQVMSNMVINFVKDVKGLGKDKEGKPKKIEDSAGRLYR